MRYRTDKWIPPFNSMLISTRFLWWPKTIEGETRWLERATWVGCVITLQDTRTHQTVDFYWADEHWLDSEEEISAACDAYASQLKMYTDWKQGKTPS